MQNILALVIVLILGYTGAHLLFYSSRFPLGTRYILSAGSEYLFFGLLLSIPAFAVLTPDILKLLSPLVNLGLGWIGLLFGIQFEWAKLRRTPLRFMGITLIQAVFSLLFVGTGLGLFTYYVFPLFPKTEILLLAIIASISSPTCIAFVQNQIPSSSRAWHLVYYVSSLDSLVGLAVFGFVYSGTLYQGWINLGFYLLLALCLILIFHLLTRFYVGHKELLILTVGLVVFSSGLAGVFGLSALLLNVLLGVGLINLPSINHRAFYNILNKQEKPLYIIFMVLAGAMWIPSSVHMLIIIIYLGLRLLGKFLGGYLSVSAFDLKFELSDLWGFSLFPQGGMGIAIAVDFLQYHPVEMGTALLNIIVITTLISQLAGPLLVSRGVMRQGQV